MGNFLSLGRSLYHCWCFSGLPSFVKVFTVCSRPPVCTWSTEKLGTGLFCSSPQGHSDTGQLNMDIYMLLIWYPREYWQTFTRWHRPNSFILNFFSFLELKALYSIVQTDLPLPKKSTSKQVQKQFNTASNTTKGLRTGNEEQRINSREYVSNQTVSWPGENNN